MSRSLKVILLCWRDTNHPEGGGSERYLEQVGQYLASQGHEVIYRTAYYPGAKKTKHAQRDGYWLNFSRAGGNLSVYPRALLALLAARLGLRVGAIGKMGTPDVVVDTQNGVPFFASLVAGAPTVVLTHHCHREQWSVAGPVLSRIGWLVESKISPLIHRRNRWVTVSQPSAEEFAELGVPAENFTIIRNGIEPVPEAARWHSAQEGEDKPVYLVALSRLVPHKQIEHALDCLAALQRSHPNLRLDVIGDGWWSENLRRYAQELGVDGKVVFHGYVSEELKHRILQRASIHVMPSRKEGWGLAVIEAAQHGVPTVGYESSAGLRDSIVDEETGLLATSPGGLINAVEHLLDDPARCQRMGQAAERRAAQYSWENTGRAWEELLQQVAKPRETERQD